MPQAMPHQARLTELGHQLIQSLASLSVAVVMTPPRGPNINRSSARRPAVSRMRVDRSASIGSRQRTRAQ
jgi:hypothetical protein